MTWLFVASSHDIIKIPRTVRFMEILVEIDSREMQTCDGTDLKISVKIREINRERTPTGQQLHRVKIITTKPENLADRDQPEAIVTFQEVLQLTNIFSIQVKNYKNMWYRICIVKNCSFILFILFLHCLFQVLVKATRIGDGRRKIHISKHVKAFRNMIQLHGSGSIMCLNVNVWNTP